MIQDPVTRQTFPAITLEAFSVTRLPNGKGVRFRCAIDGLDSWPNELWMERAGVTQFQEHELTANWAVVGMLYPAMALGRDLTASNAVSEQLLFNLNGDVQSVLMSLNPSLSRVTVRAPVLSADDEARLPSQHGVATGYSAGIDTFTTLALLAAPRATDGVRLTHLLTHNVGAMGTVTETQRLFDRYVKRSHDAAAAMHLGSIAIDSNLDSFYTLGRGTKIGYQPSHSIRGASAALVCEDILSGYHYSSSFAFPDIKIAPTSDMAYSEPILMPMLSTKRLTFFATGSSLRRIDKVCLVAEFPASYPYLDVCVASAELRASMAKPNCGTCWKCIRQLLTLDLIGKLEAYSPVFNVDEYRANKSKIIGQVVSRAKDRRVAATADREVVAMMKDKWGRVPLGGLIESLIPWGGRLERVRMKIRSRMPRTRTPSGDGRMS